MNRIRIATTLAACLVGLSLASTLAAQPKAVVPETVHDFGIVPHGDVVSTKITVENRGDATLEILRASQNCSCAVTNHPRTIEPGESGEVEVEVDTESLAEGTQFAVSLFTNDPENPRIELTFRVQARLYVFAKPFDHFRYTVHQHFDDDSLVETTVMATSPSEFRVTGVRSQLEYVESGFREATPEERDPSHAGDQFVVWTRLRPDAPVGPLTGRLIIDVDHDKQSKLALPISGFVRPILHATPTKYEIKGHDGSETPVRWSHHIKNFAQELIEIERIETDIEGLSTSVTPGENDHEFYIVCELDPDVSGKISGTITVHTTSDKVKTIEIPVSGQLDR